MYIHIQRRERERGSLTSCINGCRCRRKHHVDVDVQSYQQWRKGKNGRSSQGGEVPEGNTIVSGSSKPSGASERVHGHAPAPQSASFGRIADLILKGEQVPNVREVPDTVLTGYESSSSATRRKKPWEK